MDLRWELILATIKTPLDLGSILDFHSKKMETCKSNCITFKVHPNIVFEKQEMCARFDVGRLGLQNNQVQN